MRFSFQQILFAICIIFLVFSCGRKREVKPVPPVTQSNPVKEGDLNTISLTDKAVERLGIRTFRVIDQFVENSRAFSGEVVTTPGKIITITAPVAGTLMPAENGREMSVGQKVRKGQPIARIVILPSERDLLSVQADIAQREIQLNTAVEKVKRNTLLYGEQAGSLRAKQEAEAELAGIAAQLKVAKNRLQLLKGTITKALADRMSTLHLEAPISGVIQKVYSSATQVLATAAPIVDIVSLQTLWIRVPVYAGDQQQINASENAYVRGLSDAGSSPGAVVAKPVTGPQTSDPLTTSIDLYYEIDNDQGNYRPGQRISVTLPYKGAQRALVVPFAAIVYDINGGTWVYENTAPRTFIRRRVEVSRVSNEMAILQHGPQIGAAVVTDGAAELFGTEFGGGK